MAALNLFLLCQIHENAICWKLRFLSNILRVHAVLLAAGIAEVILVAMGRCRHRVWRIAAVVEASTKFVAFRGLNCSSPPESAFFLPLWESLAKPVKCQLHWKLPCQDCENRKCGPYMSLYCKFNRNSNAFRSTIYARISQNWCTKLVAAKDYALSAS